jgi:PAS domain S-box-containing protein
MNAKNKNSFLDWRGYLFAVALVALATWLKYLAQPDIIPADIPILFIVAIVFTATFFGYGPSIVACILSVFSYDFFFIHPEYTFSFPRIMDLPIISIFFLVGITISFLSSNLRQKNRIAEKEIQTRKKVEQELRNYEAHLEEIVEQRTAELNTANQELKHEIDERKQAQEALVQSEQRWATTLASIGDAVIATDIEGKITFMNPVAETLTGWTLQESMDKPVSEIFHIINERTRQKVESPVDKVLNLGLVCGLANHTILIRKDGSSIAIDDSGAPVKTRDGQTKGVVLVFRDITDRKQAEEALHLARQRAEILSEANNLLLTTEKPQDIVQTIACKVMDFLNCDCFFNFITDEETGKLRLNAYAGIPEETAHSRAWLDYGTAICGCAAQDGCRIISENIQENGDMRAALVRSFGVQAYACHPLRAGLKTIGTLSFGTRSRTSFTEDEISLMKTVADHVSIAMERKLTQETLTRVVQQLNAHMDNSPLAVIEFDPEFRIIRWSKEAERMFGWTSQEIQGKTISEMKWVYKDDVELVKGVSNKLKYNQTPASLNVNRNYRKDGIVIDCEWYNSSIYNSEGKLTSVLSLVLDVSQRNKAEKEIQSYARELENHKNNLENMVAERTLELQSLSRRLIMIQEDERRFISRELHDQIGQSLTVLNLLMAKTLRSPETAKTDIPEAIQMVKEVLAQVRNLSTRLHPGMLEDMGLLQTLTWYFNDFSKKTGINIIFEQSGLETDLPQDINITIYRIIQEALTNIARYAEVKQASIFLNYENQTFYIRIEDKGKGFDLETQSGFGLRGMRERVNSLNGKLKIVSAPGEGTLVIVELPVILADSSKKIHNETNKNI